MHADECRLAQLAALPVTMVGPRAIVHTQLNGHAADLFVDTGAFYSSISQATATQFGLRTHPAPFGFTVTGVGRGESVPSVTSVQSVDIAGVPLHDIEFLVDSFDEGGRAVGILGRSFLHIGDMEYDLAHGVIKVFKPSNCDKSSLAYWVGAGGGYSEVSTSINPADGWHTGTLITQMPTWWTPEIAVAYVNGEKIRVVLDSGTPSTIMSTRVAEKAGVRPDSPGVVFGGVATGVGRAHIKTYIAKFDSFQFGQEQVKHARLRFGDIGMDKADMLLGADFFLSHHILVASSQHKVYFTYNGGPIFDLCTMGGSRCASAAKDAPTDAPQTAADEEKDPDALARRASAQQSRGALDDALASINRALALAPDNADYLVHRAQIYCGLRQCGPALADLNHALTLSPGNVEALLERAGMEAAAGDAAGAKRDMAQAEARLAPQAYEHRRLAQLYVHLKDYDAAIAQDSTWLDNHPDDDDLSDVLNSRCWTRALADRDLPLARADCDRAIALNKKKDPSSARTYNSRALVMLRLGQYEKSVADYTRAIELNANDANSYYGRGIALRRWQKADASQADLAKAVSLAPQIAQTFAGYGITP